MRIYTANGLRVKIRGFFQEIITPGNKTQDFILTRNGHGEHLRNHDGNRDGSGG